MKYLNKRTLATISVLMCIFTLCSCSVKSEKLTEKPSFPMKNNTLVEVCTKHADSYPAIQLEKQNPSVECIVYEIFTTDDYKERKSNNETPYPYGSMYFKKWTRSMNSDDHRLPRTVLQRQQLDFHSYKDQTGQPNETVWLEDTTSSLHGISPDHSFVVESYEFDVEHEMYILSLSLKCVEDFFSKPPETRPPNWSLHLILNDSRDMRKNLYSWTLPIQTEEES
jgi:hypothetical protein